MTHAQDPDRERLHFPKRETTPPVSDGPVTLMTQMHFEHLTPAQIAGLKRLAEAGETVLIETNEREQLPLTRYLAERTLRAAVCANA